MYKNVLNIVILGDTFHSLVEAVRYGDIHSGTRENFYHRHFPISFIIQLWQSAANKVDFT